MELSENTINISTGDPALVEELVDRLNKNYKTNFEYLGWSNQDGVQFAHVKKDKNCKDDHIFLLGFFFGSKVRGLRDSGEINW